MRRKEKTLPNKALELHLDVTITDMLLQIGIPAHIKGYHYVREAIGLSILDIGYLDGVTKILYPSIAKTYKTTASRVERAIRHAIGIAWEKGTLGADYHFRTKPTNSEFIALFSDKIRLQLKIAGALDRKVS